MNFKDWYNQPLIRNNLNLNEAYQVWDACKEEVLKIIKSKYPKYVGDLVYEDGWDTACMSIEEEVEKL